MANGAGDRLPGRLHNIQHDELGGCAARSWRQFAPEPALFRRQPALRPARHHAWHSTGEVALMAGSLSARRRIGAVLVGGFFGTLTRYGLSTLIQGWLGKGWPYDILFINLTGALLLAAITALADATFLIGPTRRLFLNVGFLGAYTTFSSLALGDALLFNGGQWLPALLYLVLSLGGGIGAVILGDWLGNLLVKSGRERRQQAKVTRRLTLTIQPREEHMAGQYPWHEEERSFPTESIDEQAQTRNRPL